jgi:hypothetical protein
MVIDAGRFPAAQVPYVPRLGQVDDQQANPEHSSGDDSSGGARDHQGLLGDGPGLRPDRHPAVPRPAPHDLARRADRRRLDPAPRRDLARPQRRPVPRRVPRVPARRRRGPAPAARGAHRHHRSHPRRAPPPRVVPPGRRRQPLPVRLARLRRPRVHLRAPARSSATGSACPARCSTASTSKSTSAPSRSASCAAPSPASRPPRSARASPPPATASSPGSGRGTCAAMPRCPAPSCVPPASSTA